MILAEAGTDLEAVATPPPGAAGGCSWLVLQDVGRQGLGAVVAAGEGAATAGVGAGGGWPGVTDPGMRGCTASRAKTPSSLHARRSVSDLDAVGGGAPLGLAPWVPAPEGPPVGLAARGDAAAPEGACLGGALTLMLTSLCVGCFVLPPGGGGGCVAPPPLSPGGGGPSLAGVLEGDEGEVAIAVAPAPL